jgi:hypothetical protein
MPETNHPDIANADLHESKGIAAASANEVYEADGATSGDFVTLNASVAIYDYSPAAGTNHPAGTAGAWTKCLIDNEEYDGDSIASIASNQITIAAAGTYYVRYRQTFGFSRTIRLRVYNNTQARIEGLGLNFRAGHASTVDECRTAEVIAVFVAEASDVIECQYFIDAAAEGDLGWTDALAPGIGNDKYSEVELWKLSNG